MSLLPEFGIGFQRNMKVLLRLSDVKHVLRVDVSKIYDPIEGNN